jgi:DNA-binding LacI/PurR family transcriptional regulator
VAVTLAEVAERAGVAISTVSRALSAPDKVSAPTRRRILQVAEEMGYVRNHLASSLASGVTGVVGLLVPDIANPFFPPIIKAVQARAAQKGRTVLIADADEHAADELARARAMREHSDGLIVVSPRMPESELEGLADLFPVVLVNRKASFAPSVIIDDDEGFRQAVEHLHALGHRHICYLNGPQHSWSNTVRRDTLRRVCAELDIEVTEFGPHQPAVQAGVNSADLVLASGATAVIAYDDLIALGLMGRLHERGVRIGEGLSVIGVDDSPMSAMAYPTLTSVHVPTTQAGTAALELLNKLLDGRSVTEPTVFGSYLVVRGSTGPAPA